MIKCIELIKALSFNEVIIDTNCVFYVCLSLQIAMSCMDNSLLKYSAKDHFFRAAVCHLCVDTLNAQQALTRYEELVPQFADSRECKLLKVVWIVYLLLLVHSQGRV